MNLYLISGFLFGVGCALQQHEQDLFDDKKPTIGKLLFTALLAGVICMFFFPLIIGQICHKIKTQKDKPHD